ncbi:phosphatidate phosphatase PAH2-like [Durio zibethinus]|uniref:phosphatidate phosphatase n=1 Tax=Durio zibethinus TaxID=66656 RepID=A0A6P6B6Q5_DURZI|nr:phosphatidate phosphatase PAH2-like [Durio zibethinus]XP_022772868.1 phosphatidate phosphatase PAH2-like [Durio zibethinus]XP_022772869.1 phosphatidate phosphatase PAH2-like [Durio zibethinus]
MYAVGRLISRGVYTVSAPFHPFGGAVDIIVVEQPDGGFKSSPWYVRFGKFQGVLKTREKVVSISVNGIEANFHMFLDHKGEAYFLREVDDEEGESEAVSFPSSSGDETDEPSSGNRRPMKSKSCNYDADKSNSVGQVDVSNGKILARTSSRRSRIFGLVFGQRSTKEDGYREGVDGGRVTRIDSLERAEIAADLLEVKWSTNLSSNRSNNNASPFSSTKDALDKKGSEEETQINDEQNQFHSSIHDKEETKNDEENQFQSSVHDKEENSIVDQPLLEETDFCNKQKISYSHSGLENPEYFVEEASLQVSRVSTDSQIVENSLGEGFMEEKCKVIANISGTIDDRSVGNLDHDENEMGAVSGMSGPDLPSQYKLEACMDKQFDEELADNERNVVLPVRGISNKETVSDSLQSFVNCETSPSSVITSNGSSEQTHQTLCLSDVGNRKVHVHAEILVTTTKLVSEVTVLKQAKDMELDSEGALTMSESYPQMVSVDPLFGLEEKMSHSIHTTSTISDLGDQVEDEKNTNDFLHPSLEFVDDSQNFYGDSEPKRSVPASESSEDEQFLFSDLDESKLLEPDCVNKDLYPSICTENEDVNGLCNVNNESYLNPDQFVQENPSTDLENSVEKSGIISNPITISRNHRVAGEKNVWQVESLPNMWSPVSKFDANDHRPVSHSLDSTSETMKWTSIRKDDSSCIRPDADKEQPILHERSSSEDTETSGKLKNALYNPAVEISLCKHLLYEGMGAEAACQAFDAEKLDSKKFSSLGPAVVKNDRLVVRIGGRYFPWDAASPILLGMVAFGSEEIFEPKGMIPVDRVEKSIEGDPSKAIVSHSGSWRLWPFSLKRTRSRKSVQLAPADIKDMDAENAADITVATDGDKKLLIPKQVKKMIRAICPTSEQLASLNLKDGMNHITFTFSTAMLGKQQVDARIYLWKWNTHIVISDVDGTITKSDVLGQFMPLVGIDWSQTGVAHLFSAIKENGYQLLFLSARAISQAYITRQFLVNLKQDGKALPDGPIVISPDGLFPSLYREVIRRAPHEFKIACLEDIKALFPSDCNPFYAGFGNRDTDEISYLKVGIPKGKIFIINPKGEVAVNRRVDTKSYTSLHALVHGIFPPMASSEQVVCDHGCWQNFHRALESAELADTVVRSSLICIEKVGSSQLYLASE